MAPSSSSYPLGIVSYNADIIGNFERTDTFSVDLWFYPTLDRTNASLAGSFDGTRGWHIDTHGSRGKLNQIDFGLHHNLSGNAVVVTNSVMLNLPINVWYHIVITYNGSSLASGINYYVNNIARPLIVAADALTDTIKNTSKLKIGTGYYPFIPGRIDEFTLYDRVLSPVEVGQRYNGGTGTETLFGPAYLHYNLNELSGSVVSDDSGNDRHAVAIGGPTWMAGKLNNCISLNGTSQYLEA